MKQIVYISFAVAMIFLSYHIYNANLVRADLAGKLGNLQSSVEGIEKDNEKLKGDIEYFSDPHNLEKELRSRFNYRAPNEKMIIVVPPGEGQ